MSGLPLLTVHDTDGITIPKLNHYKAFLGGKGLNTSNSTYGIQWRGSMSGGSQGRFSASADSSIITYSGTPAVGATVAGNNYKLATSMLLPGIKFSTIDYKGSLRAYDADCDGETQNIEIWTCDDYNLLVPIQQVYLCLVTHRLIQRARWSSFLILNLQFHSHGDI